MSQAFALAAFLARWTSHVRHDLAASESEPIRMAELLDGADAEDLARWRDLGLGYGDPRGAPWLRAAIAARHDAVLPEDVVCCAGAQEALACAVAALREAGDHAVVVLPIYQPSEEAVTALGAAAGVPLSHGRDWHLDLDRVAAAIRPDTRLLVMNFPNSPTGAQLDRATLDGLVSLCRRDGLWLVNDEIYRGTDRTGTGQPPAVVDLYERGVSVNGLSKSFGLPGLRVGWAVARDRAVLQRMVIAKARASACLSAASEVLAHIALKAEATIVGRNRRIGAQNEERLQALMARAPDAFEPEPSRNLAFAYPRYCGPGSPDHFARALAHEAGVLVLPGSLWRSRLAALSCDRVRIGLGRSASAAALDALDAHLCRRERPVLVA